MSLVQTDGLGLGAWNKPGRGKIPYTWEVTVNDLFLQPTLMEMIYSQATPNDYFIGALSSAGYTYPKALGKTYLPHLLDVANDLMKVGDLNSYAIMDESEGTTVVGNMNLPEWVTQAYFDHMPDALGFVNGYAPSFTFTKNSSRPFLSYDYYLDPSRSIKSAASDILNLHILNPKRPYWLAIHVREFSGIERVESILSLLPKDDFELVPLDWLLQGAGQNPTFTTRFEKDAQ